MESVVGKIEKLEKSRSWKVLSRRERESLVVTITVSLGTQVAHEQADVISSENSSSFSTGNNIIQMLICANNGIIVMVKCDIILTDTGAMDLNDKRYNAKYNSK